MSEGEKELVNKLSFENKTLKQQNNLLLFENQRLKKSLMDKSFETPVASSVNKIVVPQPVDSNALKRAAHVVPKFNDNPIATIYKNIEQENGAIYCFEYSQDSTTFSIGTLKGNILVYNNVSYDAISELKAHEECFVSDLCYISNDKIASVSYDKSICLLDLNTDKVIQRMDCQSHLQRIHFSPNNNLVYVGTNKQFMQVDFRNKNSQLVVIQDELNTTAITTNKNIPNQVLTGDYNGNITNWDLRYSTPLCVYSNSKAPISDIAPPENNNDESFYICTNSYDNINRMYRLNNNAEKEWVEPVVQFSHYTNANYPIFSSLVSLKDEYIPVKHFLSKNKITARDSNSDYLFVTGSSNNTVYLYSVNTLSKQYSLLQSIKGHTNRVYGAKFNTTSQSFASFSADSSVKIWTLMDYDNKD